MRDDCYCDYDPPEFQTTKICTARKEHRCGECGCVVRAGEKYEYTFAKTYGDLWGAKVCLRCLEVRRYVQEMVPCFCWYNGNMLEDAKETIREYEHELPGLAFGLGRRLIAIKRANGRTFGKHA